MGGRSPHRGIKSRSFPGRRLYKFAQATQPSHLLIPLRRPSSTLAVISGYLGERAGGWGLLDGAAWFRGALTNALKTCIGIENDLCSFFLNIYLYIFLFGCVGLSCGTRDLHCGAWASLYLRAGFSLVAARMLSSCGAQA